MENKELNRLELNILIDKGDFVEVFRALDLYLNCYNLDLEKLRREFIGNPYADIAERLRVFIDRLWIQKEWNAEISYSDNHFGARGGYCEHMLFLMLNILALKNMPKKKTILLKDCSKWR